MKKLFIGMIVFLAVICVGLGVFMINAISNNSFSFNFNANLNLVNTESISLDNINDLQVSYTSDSIEIFEHNSNEIIVKEYMNKSKEKYHAKVEQSGSSLTICNGSRNMVWFLRSRIEVYLPASYSDVLTVSSASGSIKTGMDLDVKDLTLKNTSGSINAGSIKADNITLKNTSGSIKADSASGRMDVSNTSGSIQIKYAIGPMNVSNTSGSIKVEGGEYGGTFKNSSGSINLTNKHITSDINIKNTSGSIKINLDHNESFEFKASSTSGSIKTFFDDELNWPKKHEASGTIGDNPNYSITAKTSSGSIKITD